MITLGTVNISKKTKALLTEALRNGVIGQGYYIQEFEQKLAKFLGVKYVIATANGTLADAVALAVVKDKDGEKRSEVIVPALTFIAQINAVYYNHLTPIFVDAKYDYEIDFSAGATDNTVRTRTGLQDGIVQILEYHATQDYSN